MEGKKFYRGHLDVWRKYNSTAVASCLCQCYCCSRVTRRQCWKTLAKSFDSIKALDHVPTALVNEKRSLTAWELHAQELTEARAQGFLRMPLYVLFLCRAILQPGNSEYHSLEPTVERLYLLGILGILSWTALHCISKYSFDLHMSNIFTVSRLSWETNLCTL